MPPLFKALIIDDDPTVTFSLKSLLQDFGLSSIESCSTMKEAREYAKEGSWPIIFLDLMMDEGCNIEFISELLEVQKLCHVVVITIESDIALTTRAIQLGAFDFIKKPIQPEKLFQALRHIQENLYECEPTETPDLRTNHLPAEAKNIVGHDPLITQRLFEAQQLALSPYPILIHGESGVGKELFAKYIHDCSLRKGPYVTINAAALDDEHFSDALFGHLPQSFTGIKDSRSGLVHQARHGTLVLDEIGDLSPVSQVKLLRLIQNNEYYPLGSDKVQISLTRLIFCTNANLRKRCEEGTFRSDLYYRLHSHHLHIPPLRHRQESLEELIFHFIATTCHALDRPIVLPNSAYLEQLKTYAFPGNVRELENLIRQDIMLAKGKFLSTASISNDSLGLSKNADLAMQPTPNPDESASNSFSEFFKRCTESELLPLKELADTYVNEVLSKTGHVQVKASKILGISSQALSQRLMKRRTSTDL
jgi:DNA-binding NtrC family response regulator